MSGPSGKLSRAWFDIIVLATAAAVVGGFVIYRFWPIGCSNRAFRSLAQETIRRDLKADRVTFHMIEKTARTRSELICSATARIEFETRNSEYRDVAYQAQIDEAGRVAAVKAAIKPPQE